MWCAHTASVLENHLTIEKRVRSKELSDLYNKLAVLKKTNRYWQ